MAELFLYLYLVSVSSSWMDITRKSVKIFFQAPCLPRSP